MSETGDFNRVLGKIEGGLETLTKGQSNIFDRLGKVEIHMATQSEKVDGIDMRVTKIESQPKKSAAKWGGIGVLVSGIVLGVFKGISYLAGKISGGAQ